MKKLSRLLFATVLTAAAILSMPPKASASAWCETCVITGGCFECCRCGGATSAECIKQCG